jgi:uncharacterized membrane protein YczE
MDTCHLKNRDPYAYIQLMVGLLALAFGIVFILKSGLGMNPWNVFHVGITLHLPLTLGRVIQIVGLFLIVISFFLGVSPGVGTLLCMIFVGIFVDVINPWIPPMNSYVYQGVLLLLGILCIGLGTGLYINSNLGAGPRDSLMLALHKKTKKSIQLVRNSIEITVLITGFILGGPFGVGTIAFALGIGPVVQFFLKVVPKREIPEIAQV